MRYPCSEFFRNGRYSRSRPGTEGSATAELTAVPARLSAAAPALSGVRSDQSLSIAAALTPSNRRASLQRPGHVGAERPPPAGQLRRPVRGLVTGWFASGLSRGVTETEG